MNPASVSFIIPHAGRSEMLVETIESILAQEPADNAVQIIVVTQNPDLETRGAVLIQIANLRCFSTSGSGRRGGEPAKTVAVLMLPLAGAHDQHHRRVVQSTRVEALI